MKVAVLGGGYTGLSAAYYLAKKGYKVTLFEKEKTLGGLAVGFKSENWDWYLEKVYHHLLSSEDDILNFADQIEFKGIFFKSPETASLYELNKNRKLDTMFFDSVGTPLQNHRLLKSSKQVSSFSNYQNNYRIFPLDNPQDFLRFPLLSLPEKVRAGFVLTFLKLSPFLSSYEKQTAEEFLRKSMGDEAWKVLWQELFRKKFGKYAENILASFIWARIKKREKSLGYIEGGFQALTDFIEKKLIDNKVKIKKVTVINDLRKKGSKFVINNEEFELVISTLPTPIIAKLGENLFPQNYLGQLKKIEYLHAVDLILETKQPILEKTYWLNICAKEIPIMILCQQTNFIDKKYYGGKHICYVGWYVNLEDRIWKMEAGELLKFVLPYLYKISNFKLQIPNSFLFKGPFAQPIFDKNFVKNKPDFITPVKNFFIANLDMTYPYDRGTNYAVKLGREVSELI